ncbi:MAG TPA: cysteinyl-tRNA synthetase [Anaerolineae bacterium]|nr:cysteinyl-tRNA synthetase [Anaerolineae bacterium]HMR66632.1 cysteinyl-tRNA synthetase [Anaerolineae bacterium]
MAVQPGLITLLGSGETAPSIRKVYHGLFERMTEPVKLGILETPAGFEPNSAKVAQNIADFMSHRLQNFKPEIDIIPARKRGTNFSPDDPAIAAQLHDRNVILIGPGSPTYTARQLRDSLTWQTMIARHRLGAHMIFASAATIASGYQALPVYEIYKVGEDLHWQPGLDFFAAFGLSLVFIPHWNNNDGGDDLDTSHCYMGTQRYDQLVALLPDQPTLVGLDEHTALVIDPVAECCRVMGVSHICVIRDGQEKLFPNGSTFSIHELGDFRMPEPSAGLPLDVWQQVVQAQPQDQDQTGDGATPPPEVLKLVEQREAVRARKDWAASDAMRAKIQTLGWKVVDTPDGSLLEPV